MCNLNIASSCTKQHFLVMMDHMIMNRKYITHCTTPQRIASLPYGPLFSFQPTNSALISAVSICSSEFKPTCATVLYLRLLLCVTTDVFQIKRKKKKEANSLVEIHTLKNVFGTIYAFYVIVLAIVKKITKQNVDIIH